MEAYYIGLLLLASAGYDPRVAPTVYEKFDKLDSDSRNKDYLSTHPSGKKRAELLAQAKLAEDYYQARMANRITSKRQHVIDFIRWRPPQVNWVKLNTDGACKGGNIAGCGGIIRGSDGEWIGGFAKFIGDCSAFVAELWGVLEGLRYVRRMGYTAVELNVDCVSVEKTIKKGVTDSRLGRALVNKIRRLLEMDWNVVVSHSY